MFFLIAAVAWMGFVAWVNLRFYLRSGSQRSIDASSKSKLAPDDLLPIMEQLFSLGFERLGEAEFPYLPKSFQTYWIFTDPAKTTFAEIATIFRHVQLNFMSQYADDSVIQTAYIISYPAPPSIRSKNLRLHKITTSIKDAYSFHLAQIHKSDLGSRHGELILFTTMLDYLRHEASYRTLFARRLLRSRLLLYVVLPTMFVISVFIFPIEKSPILPILMFFTTGLLIGVVLLHSFGNSQLKRPTRHRLNK